MKKIVDISLFIFLAAVTAIIIVGLFFSQTINQSQVPKQNQAPMTSSGTSTSSQATPVPRRNRERDGGYDN